jgi:hypothetical protein
VESRTEVAVIDPEELARLVEALDTAASGTGPVTGREFAPGLEANAGDEPDAAGDDAADLISRVQRGINIAAHIESRPLIPLYEAAGENLPPAIKVDHEKMGYDFYLAEITFSVLLDGDEQLRAADFELRLSDDVTDKARKTRPVRIFPGRKDVDLFRVEVEGAVGLDVDLHLSVPSEAQAVLPFAKAAAQVKAGVQTKMIAGPYSFQFRKAAIEVLGESDPLILWRYKLASELAGKNDFKSMLVLKVAKEATRIDAAAILEVVPFKKRWLLFEKVLPKLTMRAKLPIELARR